MAAEYRSVHTEMWRADDWFQTLPTDARLLWIYLFTNPSASVAGIYKLPLRTMANETGLDLSRVTDLLAEFSTAKKAYYQDGIVWVRKMRDYQLPGKTSPQLIAHLNKEIAKIPDGYLKREYLIAYGYSIDTHKKSADTVSIPRATETDTDTDTDTETLAPLAHDDADMTPEQRAIRNAYDACGITFSKTHQDAHLETIKRTGLPAWQLGFAEALKAGKHNIPKYVARCAESAMLAAQRKNGNGRTDTRPGFGLQSLTTDADRAYHNNPANSPEAIAAAQIEWDAWAAQQAAALPSV
jgi:hypothetical protein